MKWMIVPLVVAASTALADNQPVVEHSTRTFYNDAERGAWRPAPLPTSDALATIDTEKEYDVSMRRFYLMPVIGGEITTLGGTFQRNSDGSVSAQTAASGVYGAPSFGALLGWRLGGFNVGARYQGSVYGDTRLDRLMLNKVYGEIGFNARRGRAIFNGYLDAGWAFASSSGQPLRNGIGGKAGVAVDFLATRYLSFGPGLEFDVQGYATDNSPTWVAVYGGSAFLRIGVQL